MEQLFINASMWLNPFFLIYFSVINIVYVTLLVFGTVKVFRRQKELNVEDFTNIRRSNSLPEISIIVPVFNEDSNVIQCVQNLINLTYRYKQIIIVNDGSKDETLDFLKTNFHLINIPLHYDQTLPSKPIKGIYQSSVYPQLYVLDKDHSGKFDSLNAALNMCTSKFFITVDADTFIDDSNFETLIRPILSSPKTVAIGAATRIKNECLTTLRGINTAFFPQSYLPAMQSIEYLKMFHMRQGWDYLGGNYCVSGAFAIYATDVIKQVGGFAPTHANDTEIILRLNRILMSTKTPFEIHYLPDPVAWTEVPESTTELGNQRKIWHQGMLESFWFNKELFFNPKYGKYGLFVFPFFVLGEALQPLIEILGIIYILATLLFGVINPYFIALFLCLTIGFSFLFTLFSLLIEELSFRKYPTWRNLLFLMFYSFVENFGYRQLNLIWKLRGFGSFFKNFHIIRKKGNYIKEKSDKAIKKGRLKWQ